MLDHLDEIPWKHLHHAYGSAEDVPGLLRALTQPDKQEEVLIELYGNIWHQGTVYEASSYAVSFLFELAVEPATARRDEILGLIGALASGKSYLAVHARPGLKIGDTLRQKPDFEEQLSRELENVRSTRDAVLKHADATSRLLKDPIPMVRAGAAYVLSRFTDHVSEFGHLIRQAAMEEGDSLALAAMLWCIGAIGDTSPEAVRMLDSSLRAYSDPREAFAAAIALYQMKNQPYPAAMSFYRQMAAATWFAESVLTGVPWDSPADFRFEDKFPKIEPDPVGATQMLLHSLRKIDGNSYLKTCIVHDLLQMNFVRGNWRESTHLTKTQMEILQCLVDADSAWADTQRLWFLIPNGAQKISQLNPTDIQNAREDMRSVLKRSRISP